MASAAIFFFSGLLLCFTAPVESYSCDAHGSYDNLYCTYGCCDFSPYQRCCSSSHYWSNNYYDDPTVDWGAIIGGSVGGLVSLVIVIALVCICIKKLGKPTHVVQPIIQQPVPATTVAVSGSSGQYPTYPTPAYPMGPQGTPHKGGEAPPPGYAATAP